MTWDPTENNVFAISLRSPSETFGRDLSLNANKDRPRVA